MYWNPNTCSYCTGTESMNMGVVLTAMWWIYVLIMAPSMLFTGGFYEFVLGLVAVAILLMLPAIFYKS